MTGARLILIVIFLGITGAAVWLYLQPDEQTGNRRGGRTISVVGQKVVVRPFSDLVEAIGTARAVASVTLTARVTDTVKTLHFKDGQVVLKGDPIVDLVDSEEQAQLAEERTNVTEAEQQFNRIKDLVTRGNASDAQLDAQRRILDAARARVRAAEARLADRRVRAPFDGVLGFRLVSLGSLITPQTAITTLDRVDVINLDFSVPERFLAVLKNDLEVTAKARAFQNRPFIGKVTTVGSRVDPATRSVVVRAEIPNRDMVLRPGMLMTVSLVARNWQAIAVPEEAIVPAGGRNFVFRVRDGVTERIEVGLGIRRPGYVEITSGIEEGDTVVTEGTFRLGREAVKVDLTVEPSAADQPVPVGEG